MLEIRPSPLYEHAQVSTHTTQTSALNTAQIFSPEHSHSFSVNVCKFQLQYPSTILNLTSENQISHVVALQKQLFLTLVFLLKAPLIYQSPKSKRNFTTLFFLCLQAHLKPESHLSAIPVASSCTRCSPSVSRLYSRSVGGQYPSCLACVCHMGYILVKWSEGSISVLFIPTIPP